MAGIEFDRQAFVPNVGPKERSILQMAGPIVLVLASSLMGYLGYKIFLVKTQESDLAAANLRIHGCRRPAIWSRRTHMFNNLNSN